MNILIPQATIQGVPGARDDAVVNQPFARDDAVVRGFRRIVQSETKIRKHMGRTLWWFANRNGGDDERGKIARTNCEKRWRRFQGVENDDLRGNMP